MRPKLAAFVSDTPRQFLLRAALDARAAGVLSFFHLVRRGRARTPAAPHGALVREAFQASSYLV